jgi:hypothetical protein
MTRIKKFGRSPHMSKKALVGQDLALVSAPFSTIAGK